MAASLTLMLKTLNTKSAKLNKGVIEIGDDGKRIMVTELS